MYLNRAPSRHSPYSLQNSRKGKKGANDSFDSNSLPIRPPAITSSPINPELTAEEEDLLKLGEGAAFNTSAVTLDSNSSPKAMPAEENMGKVTDESVPDDIEEEERENKIDSMLRNKHIQKYNSDSSS